MCCSIITPASVAPALALLLMYGVAGTLAFARAPHLATDGCSCVGGFLDVHSIRALAFRNALLAVLVSGGALAFAIEGLRPVVFASAAGCLVAAHLSVSPVVEGKRGPADDVKGRDAKW